MPGKLIGVIALLIGTMMAATSDAGAQPIPDCGNTCQTCGTFGYEGRGFAVGGSFKMDCVSFLLWCTACGDARSNLGSDAEILLVSIKSAEQRALRDIVAANGQRLSLIASRGMVVLRGTKCDPDAIAAVVRVSADQARRLAAAGVQPFVERRRRDLSGKTP